MCLVAAFWFIWQSWGEQELRKLTITTATMVLVKQAFLYLHLSLQDTLSPFSWHLLLQYWAWKGNTWKQNPKPSFLSPRCVTCSDFQRSHFSWNLATWKNAFSFTPLAQRPLKCFITKYVNYTLTSLSPQLKPNHSESKNTGYSQ